GGDIKFNISDVEIWKPAFAELLKKIVNSHVDLIGRRTSGSVYEKVRGDLLANILIDYPYQISSDVAFGNTPFLECFGVGHDDKLWLGHGQLEWDGLRIRADDVYRHWPFDKVEIKGDQNSSELRKKRGRKTKYDWEDAREFARKLLKDLGPFR